MSGLKSIQELRNPALFDNYIKGASVPENA